MLFFLVCLLYRNSKSSEFCIDPFLFWIHIYIKYSRHLLCNGHYKKYLKTRIQHLLVPKLLYNSKCISVCQLWGHVIFLAAIKDRGLIFFVNIPLIYEYLFYIFQIYWFLGQATKNEFNIHITSENIWK